jgi:hypothetical protein
MRRVLPTAEFQRWLHRFLPDLARGEPKTLLLPATVTDRSDPQIVHLDGLNLSRAWCLSGMAAALPESDPRACVLRKIAERHRAAGMTGIDAAQYVGGHWLASFALLALDAQDER